MIISPNLSAGETPRLGVKIFWVVSGGFEVEKQRRKERKSFADQIKKIKFIAMNKKLAQYGFWFYILGLILSIFFPKIIYGNIVVTVAYFAICLVFIYFIYFRKVRS